MSRDKAPRISLASDNVVFDAMNSTERTHNLISLLVVNETRAQGARGCSPGLKTKKGNAGGEVGGNRRRRR